MNVLILTGPAAAGKNTISAILAKKRNKCAVIDVDQVRWMYRQPHKAPWEGEEGKQQQMLGVENSCQLAKNFINNGVDGIILDVLTNETAQLYKKLLPGSKIIIIMPTYAEAHKRFVERQHTITEEEFKLVYEWQEKLTNYDEKIDNTILSAEKVADNLIQLMEDES